MVMRAATHGPLAFDPELVKWLRIDSTARARSKDEVNGLDGDPYFNAQDPCTRYAVQSVRPQGSGYLVDILGQGGIGWINSYWGLIIPHSVGMFSIFLLMQYMRTIPDELLDAARIDGASEFRIYWQIILPLSRPALAAVGIFTFTFFWDDFFWPLIIISNPDLYTLPLGLALFVVKNRTVWDLLMAGSVIATVPMILMFLFFQRNFVRGISVSGLKG